MAIMPDSSLKSFDPTNQVLIIETIKVGDEEEKRLKAEDRYGFLGWRAVRRMLSSSVEYHLDTIARELLEKNSIKDLYMFHSTLTEQISKRSERDRIKNIRERLLQPISKHNLSLAQKAFASWDPQKLPLKDRKDEFGNTWSLTKDATNVTITLTTKEGQSLSIAFNLQGPPLEYRNLTEAQWALIKKAFTAVSSIPLKETPKDRPSLIQKAFESLNPTTLSSTGQTDDFGTWSLTKEDNKLTITQNPKEGAPFSISFNLQGPLSISINNTPLEDYSTLTQDYWALIEKAFLGAAKISLDEAISLYQ